MGTHKIGKDASSTDSRHSHSLSPAAPSFQDALKHHQSGQFVEAESKYRDALQTDPRHFESNLFFGAFLIERGRAKEARAYLERSLEINPDFPQAQHYLALALHESGELDLAVEKYEEAIVLAPANAEAWLHAGNAYAQLGQDDQAERCYREAVEHRPQFSTAHHQWAELLRKRNDTNQAIDRYRQAIKADRTSFPSLHNLATLLKSLGRHQEAIPYYATAIQAQPTNVDLRANIALCFAQSGRTADAIQIAEDTAARFPNSAFAFESLGRVQQSCGQVEKAKSSYRRALELDPTAVESRVLLANMLLVEFQLDEAKSLFEAAHSLSPHDEAAALGMAQVAEQLDEVDTARTIYLSLKHDCRDALIAKLRAASSCPTLFETEEEIDAYRQELTNTLEECRQGNLFHRPEDWVQFGIVPPFNLQFHGRDDLPLKRLYGQTIAETLDFSLNDDRVKGSFDQRPRIGLITLRNDRAFLRSIGGLIKRIDSSQLEPIIIALPSSKETLEAALGDSVQYLWLPPSIHQMAEAIRSTDLDLLYYFEIGTSSLGYLLAHQRLAPVQCTSWGVQVTSGIPTIDFYISSKLIEGDGAKEHYSEQLVLLDTLLSWQEPPEATPAASKESFGFSNDQHLYLCPQQLGKFVPRFDEVLARILRNDPRGIIMVTEGNVPQLASRLKGRWNWSIPDVANRIHFVPQQRGNDYGRLIRSADVLLDPITFGGVNTTYDALSVGKAIVTLPSPYQRGRYTAGCYQAMKMNDCIATSIEDYIDRAVVIASNPDRRTAIERTIIERNEILFRNEHSAVEWNDILLQLATRRGGASWSS